MHHARFRPESIKLKSRRSIRYVPIENPTPNLTRAHNAYIYSAAAAAARQLQRTCSAHGVFDSRSPSCSLSKAKSGVYVRTYKLARFFSLSRAYIHVGSAAHVYTHVGVGGPDEHLLPPPFAPSAQRTVLSFSTRAVPPPLSLPLPDPFLRPLPPSLSLARVRARAILFLDSPYSPRIVYICMCVCMWMREKERGYGREVSRETAYVFGFLFHRRGIYTRIVRWLLKFGGRAWIPSFSGRLGVFFPIWNGAPRVSVCNLSEFNAFSS